MTRTQPRIGNSDSEIAAIAYAATNSIAQAVAKQYGSSAFSVASTTVVLSARPV